MILAAGRGTRMGALTEKTPKPLLPLAGMPLIEYHVRALASVGVTDIIINVAWLGDHIVDALGDGSRFSVQLEYSYEPDGALETAGGIANVLPWLGEDPFIVINGDVWTDFPLHRLRDYAGSAVQDNRAAPRAHLVMVPNPAHHPNGDFLYAPEGPDGVGKLFSVPKRATASVGTQRTSDELSSDASSSASCDSYTRLTYSGIGVFSPALFSNVSGRAPLGPLLHEWIAAGMVSAERFSGHWWDVGTPERMSEVNAFLQGVV